MNRNCNTVRPRYKNTVTFPRAREQCNKYAASNAVMTIFMWDALFVLLSFTDTKCFDCQFWNNINM